MSKFKPLWYQKSVLDIDYSLLKKKGIHLIIFDLDNTIRKIDEEKPSERIIQLFDNLSKEFDLVVASNSHQKRVSTFCRDLKCNYYANMLKPSKKLYRKVLKNKNIKNNEICLIGDQIMTDMFLGNRLGIMTILVDKLGEKDLQVTKFNRLLEKRIMKKLGIKRGEYYAKD